MANSSLQALHHPLLGHPNHLHLLSPLESTLSFLFLKTTSPSSTTTRLFTTYSISSSLTHSSPSSSSSSSSTITTTTISFDILHQHLSSQNFRQADEETRRLLIALAGDAAVKRGYVFFSEVKFIAKADLRAIDTLWKEHSGNRFGYRVQRRIWEKKAKKDFTSFFLRVGWMKKLESEVEQYNYRAFPDEFKWELRDDTPAGHLPLTNALRGTQLLNSILTHPAFEALEEEEEVVEVVQGGGEDKVSEENLKELKQQSAPKTIGQRSFKPDYSF